MATNFPGPYEIDYTLLISGIERHIRYNCVPTTTPTPGAPLSTVNLMTRSGTPRAADTCVNELWTWVRLQYSNAVSCTGVTLSRYTPASFEKTYVTAATVSTPAGGNVAATVLASQRVMSYRSANGGILKLTFIEGIFTGNTRLALVANASGTNDQKLAAYTIGATSWMVARDDGFAIAPVYLTDGQNERAFKQRFR